MSTDERIPLDVLLDGAGHLTEEGATLVADGEEALLPDAVRGHAGACDECTRRVGEAALLSSSVGEWMRDERAVRAQEAALATAREAFDTARSSSRAPRLARVLPLRAIAAALALAAIGLVPTLAAGGGSWQSAGKTAAVLAKAAVTFARMEAVGAGPLRAVLACASALVLTAFAVVVARRLPTVEWAERGA